MCEDEQSVFGSAWPASLSGGELERRAESVQAWSSGISGEAAETEFGKLRIMSM